MLRLRVPFQLSEVQFSVSFADCLTPRLCHGVQVEHVRKELGAEEVSPALPAAGGCAARGECPYGVLAAIAFPDWCCWARTKGSSFAVTRQLFSHF